MARQNRGERPAKNAPPERETPAALAAKLAYAAMPPAERSLSRLAVQMRAAQEARYQEALAAGDRRPLRPRTVSSIEQRLKIWSTTFGWQEYVKEQERAREEREREEQRARAQAEQEAALAATREMNDIQADVAKGMFIRAFTHINNLLDEDAAMLAAYREAMAVWNTIPLIERMDAKPPLLPKPHFGPLALTNLAKLSTDVWRLSRGASNESLSALGERTQATLPPIFEVMLTPAPPPPPVDPYEGETVDSTLAGMGEVLPEGAEGALGSEPVPVLVSASESGRTDDGDGAAGDAADDDGPSYWPDDDEEA